MGLFCYFDNELIVGEVDVWRECWVGGGVEADAVAHVGKVGLAGCDAADDVEGGVKMHVGVMRRVAQGIDDEHGDAVQTLNLVVCDFFAIGDVSQWADAESQDGHLAMHDGDGLHLDALNHEGVGVVDSSAVEQRYSGVWILSKTVWQSLTKAIDYILTGIDGEMAVETIGTQVVDAADVVVVDVRQQERIDMVVGGTEHLLAKVGTAIDEDAFATISDNGRGAQTIVTRVGRATYLAIAAQRWYARAGASA